MIIDDDFLSKEEIDGIEETLLSERLLWHFNKSILGDTTRKESDFFVDNIDQTDSFQFNHIFYADEEERSEYAYIAEEIFKRFITKNNIVSNRVLRAKANITTPYFKKSPFAPHIDYATPHKVFLYYINESDGDTLMYNEKWQKMGETVSLTEKNRVSPKAGRGICFDGLNYHTALPPQTSPYRAVINIAFL
jgi:hypothetical protein